MIWKEVAIGALRSLVPGGIGIFLLVTWGNMGFPLTWILTFFLGWKLDTINKWFWGKTNAFPTEA